MSADVRISGYLFRWSQFSHKWVCDTCSALVLAPAAHADWHAELNRAAHAPFPPRPGRRRKP